MSITLIIWAIFSAIVLSLLTAVLYRMTGIGADYEHYGLPKWATKRFWRRIVLPVLCTSYMMIFGKFALWQHGASLLLMCVFMTTYWDCIGGWNKKQDNFFLHGLFLGLAYLPYCFPIVAYTWCFVTLRAIVMSLWMGINCYYATDDNFEELVGRGLIIGLTMPILLLG